jgi:hypothetical protein
MDLESHLAEHLELIALFVLGAEFNTNKNEESERSWSSTKSGLSSQLWSHPSEFMRGSQSHPSMFEGQLSDIGDDQILPVGQYRAPVDIRRYARPFLDLLRRQSSTTSAEDDTKGVLQRRMSSGSVVEKSLIGNTKIAESGTAGPEVQMEANFQLETWFRVGMEIAFRLLSDYVTIAVLVIRWHDAVDDYKEVHDSEV